MQTVQSHQSPGGETGSPKSEEGNLKARDSDRK